MRFIPHPRTREHAIELVEQGEIEAALEPYPLHANPKMRYLMEDFRRAEKQFFHRTGAYTINHLFALREEIAKTHPEIVRNLLVALREANAIADGYRDEKQKSEAAWEKEVMGEEFSYSLKEGCARRSLDTLMEYQIQQGILDRKPELEDLFFPETSSLKLVLFLNYRTGKKMTRGKDAKHAKSGERRRYFSSRLGAIIFLLEASSCLSASLRMLRSSNVRPSLPVPTQLVTDLGAR